LQLKFRALRFYEFASQGEPVNCGGGVITRQQTK